MSAASAPQPHAESSRMAIRVSTEWPQENILLARLPHSLWTMGDLHKYHHPQRARDALVTRLAAFWCHL